MISKETLFKMFLIGLITLVVIGAVCGLLIIYFHASKDFAFILSIIAIIGLLIMWEKSMYTRL